MCTAILYWLILSYFSSQHYLIFTENLILHWDENIHAFWHELYTYWLICWLFFSSFKTVSNLLLEILLAFCYISTAPKSDWYSRDAQLTFYCVILILGHQFPGNDFFILILSNATPERQKWNRRASTQFSSVTQSCLTLCDPMDSSMPGLPIHHQLLELIQTHVHWIDDAI